MSGRRARRGFWLRGLILRPRGGRTVFEYGMPDEYCGKYGSLELRAVWSGSWFSHSHFLLSRIKVWARRDSSSASTQDPSSTAKRGLKLAGESSSYFLRARALYHACYSSSVNPSPASQKPTRARLSQVVRQQHEAGHIWRPRWRMCSPSRRSVYETELSGSVPHRELLVERQDQLDSPQCADSSDASDMSDWLG